MTAEIKEEIKLKIPTQYLPEDWKKIGAETFGLSESMIEKHVYGTVKKPNTSVLAFFVEMAEKGKKEQKELEDQLKGRIKDLSAE